jgi:EAL domain-containing protein (putative c-di-GMP-specific phosphodiesterase class I)
VAVNISAKQVRSKSFVSSVMKALNRSGANPHNLELELTETMLFEDVEDLIAKMAVLKAYGVSFSIDDFGTGYSSLAYLKHFPLDRLKIDRSFVSDLPDSASSRAIAQAIVSLGDALGLSVIAEGVETERQQQILAELGCNAYQGYLFSKPLPVEQLELSLLTFSEAGLFIQKGQQFSLHVQ